MNPCTVVMYHYVRNVEATPFTGIKALSVADFERQLDWLQAQRTVIDYATFEALLDGQARVEGPTALLTFDDGFVDHYEAVFPVLKQRGLSGVFFLAGMPMDVPPGLLNVHRTHFLLARLGMSAMMREVAKELADGAADGTLPSRDGVYRYDERHDRSLKQLLNYELPFDVADVVLGRLFERHLGSPSAFASGLYLSKAMVDEMVRAGMTFGWHTQTHRVLSRLDRQAQARELAGGLTLVRDLTGQPRVPFCYPYGHAHTYNQDTLELLQELGYASAFTVVRRAVRFNAPGLSRYELPRYDCKDLPPFQQPQESVSAHA